MATVCVAGSTPSHKASSNSTDRDSTERKRLSVAKFQPPSLPPARKNWVPDTQQSLCMVCQRERFTMVRGRRRRGRGPTSSAAADSVGMRRVTEIFFFFFSALAVQQTASLSQMWPPGVRRLLGAQDGR